MILVDEGSSPLILCLPHSGTEIPAAVGKRLNATGRLQTDLAWRLEEIMRFGPELSATTIRSTVSRYVIDLDRDPETPLSAAGDPAAALCPVTTLDGKRLYLEDEEPGATEIEQRILLFSAPFHKALQIQVDRLLRLHDKVIVLDCQSMRSTIKGVTDSGLPVISVGSMDGTSCDPDLRNLLVGSFKSQKGYTVGVDELAKGGYLTQTLGRPEAGLHALTLLFAQRAYLRHESPPFEPDKSRVLRLRSLLEDCFSRAIDWAEMEGVALQSPVTAEMPENAEPDAPSIDETVESGPEDDAMNDASIRVEGEEGRDPQSALQVAE